VSLFSRPYSSSASTSSDSETNPNKDETLSKTPECKVSFFMFLLLEMEFDGLFSLVGPDLDCRAVFQATFVADLAFLCANWPLM
jgi:hypothetical protein